MRKMKYSGIEWIGDIPEHWEVIKLKYLGICKNGLTYSPDNVVDEDKGILVLRSSNIQDGKLVFEDNVYVNLQNDLFKIQKGDILICSRNGSRSLIGKNAIIDKEIKAYYGAFMMIYRCKSPKYMYYILNSNIFKYYLGSFFTSTINQLTGENFKNIIIPYTFNDVEQQKIAAYLDKKCASIDSIIDKEQKLIEKLKEYKQSLITETVTKGLNPDAPTKDSGVEWIGDIPEHWEILKMRFVVEKIGDIDHYMPNSIDNGIPYIMTGDLCEKFSNIHFNKCKQISLKDYELLSKKIIGNIDDIIYARYATIGTISYIDINKKSVVSYSCVIIRPLKEIMLGRFLFYYLKSNVFFEEIRRHTNANTQENVGIDTLYKTKIICPSKSEQQKIADYLDEKCARIDENISKRQALIEKLNKYKKSLIYEIVTGKMEV